MRNRITLFLVVLTISLVSCNDECNEGEKATPASFFVEIVDETSGENVFENETYTAQQITIQDLNDEIEYEIEVNVQNEYLID